MNLKLKKIFNLFLPIPVVVFSASLSSCSLDPKIIFANYESYMASNLMSRLSSEYPVRFDFYPSNENLITNFLNATYTIGVPSTYAVIELVKKNSITKLEWEKFKILNNDKSGYIKNADEALQLFTEPVKHILQNSMFDENNKPINLLEYAIPYFLQSFIFAYNNEKIKEFSIDNDITWKQIFETIVTPKYRNRFGNGKLNFVNDERTVFSVANLIYSNNVSVNPDPRISSENNFYYAMKEYANIFSSISNILNKNNFPSNPVAAFFNSDSSIILNKLSRKESEGAILFNSDAIFGGLGGDFPIENKLPIPGEDIHFVVPRISGELVTPIALDMVVINKSNYDFLSEESKNDTYSIIRETVLEGINDDKKPIWNSDSEELVIEGENAPGPVVNFDYLNYISPIKEIDDHVEDYFRSSIEEKYSFSEMDETSKKERQSKILDEVMQAYKIEPNKKRTFAYLDDLIEKPLTQKEKVIMIQSFLRFVNNNF